MSNFRAGDRVTMRNTPEYGGTVVRRINSRWVRVIWDDTSTISTERAPTRGNVIL
jgi:hypothetical protein